MAEASAKVVGVGVIVLSQLQAEVGVFRAIAQKSVAILVLQGNTEAETPACTEQRAAKASPSHLMKEFASMHHRFDQCIQQLTSGTSLYLSCFMPKCFS